MNPFLEQESVWHDFHERFIPLVAELLAAQVDPNYIVKIDEHVYIHELPAEARRFVGRGDVAVAEFPASPEPRTGAALLAAPAQVLLPHVDLERISFVEIRSRDDWKLITVIELLSPSNKDPGPDREQYAAKRSQLLNSPVHFVELDLLRGGPRLPLENLPPCDYYALVSRSEQRPKADIWPLRLRDALPAVPIPLHAPDGDAELNLPLALNRIYDSARYQTYIYAGQPKPRLTPEDAAWARQFVPSTS
jgi:hypothetical protein